MVDDFIRTSIDRARQQFLSYSVSNLTVKPLHKNISHYKQVLAKVDNTFTQIVPVFFPIFTGKNTYTYTSAHTDLFYGSNNVGSRAFSLLLLRTMQILHIPFSQWARNFANHAH